VLAHDLMRDGAARERHFFQLAARRFDGLAHGFADLVGLAGSDADVSLPISHRHQAVAVETATTLHGLGHAVDGDHVLDEPVALPLPVAALTIPAPSPPTTAATTAAAATAATTATTATTAARWAVFLCGRRGGGRGRRWSVGSCRGSWCGFLLVVHQNSNPP